MICVSVSGGRHHQRQAVSVATAWFARFAMHNAERVVIEIRIQRLADSWGWVSESESVPSVYFVALERRQSLRSMLATLLHELTHVQQYESGRWIGDGESEAISAEVLADAVWLAGLV